MFIFKALSNFFLTILRSKILNNGNQRKKWIDEGQKERRNKGKRRQRGGIRHFFLRCKIVSLSLLAELLFYHFQQILITEVYPD